MAMENEDRFVRLLKQEAGEMALDQNKQEIERAIANVKQTAADKVLTRQFFRSEARKRWSDERWRRYIKWRRKQEEERSVCHAQEQKDRRMCEVAEREPSENWWRWGPGGKLERRGEKRRFRKKVNL